MNHETCHDKLMLARGLLTLSSVVLAITGLAYVLAPGPALAIVGIESSPTSDFLLRTEGVAILFGAAVVWALRGGDARAHRIGLLALAGYYIGSAIVDLAAYGQAIVGWASIPSAIVRISVGCLCLGAVWFERRRRSRDLEGTGADTRI